MKSDIMINFEYCARNKGLDFSVYTSGRYLHKKTRRAYYWFLEGYLTAQKA